MAQISERSAAVPTYEGRLELTWTNKPLRLLAHEDGSYEWVPPSDYRVAEVRLLHDAGAVGEVHGKRDRAKDNLLIRGDALNALTSLIELPEFEREYVGKVKLAYLDPPFNTQQSFLHYDDALEHSVWLTMMRDRLVQIRDLLAPDGSVWLHLDDAEVHHARCLLDEIFGSESFVATVLWQRVDNARSRATAGIAPAHDFLLVYGRNPDFAANREALLDELPAHYDQIDEEGRSYCSRQLRKTGSSALRVDRPGMWFPITAPDGTVVWPIRADGSEGRWQWGKDRVVEKLDTLDWKRNRSGGWEPFMRIYPADERSVPFTTWWPYDEVGSNRVSKLELRALFPNVTLFATPKPEALLQRVISIGSKPDDIVLDCFLGSGTTAAVAQKMGRRWIGVEREASTIDSFARPRLEKVVKGTDPGGISQSADWSGGGGGFRMLDVAPSMFEAIDGQVFLSEWATNGKLAEVTAAQLHYDYEYAPPFVGRRGRSRLAVIDGLVNEDVVRLVVNALPEDERVVVCGTAIDPEAKDAVRRLRSGSTVRKIPHSILQEYRQAARWIQPNLFAGTSNGVRMPEGEAAPA